MTRELYLSDLFSIEPQTWGLRGDPYLWATMKEYFCSTPLPATSAELDAAVSAAFKLLTGKPITTKDYFLVEKYAHGGMSSGYIAPDWWRDEVMPLLGQALDDLLRGNTYQRSERSE